MWQRMTALRECGAAVELVPCFRARANRSKDKWTAAPRAGRRIRVSRLKRCDMRPTRGKSLRHGASAQGFNDRDNSLVWEYRRGESFDVCGIAAVHDVRGHVGFELAIAPEHHHRVNLRCIQLEVLHDRLHVAMVLVQRVLNSELAAWLHDGPLRRLRVTEDPPVDVLGLDDEHSKS